MRGRATIFGASVAVVMGAAAAMLVGLAGAMLRSCSQGVVAVAAAWWEADPVLAVKVRAHLASLRSSRHAEQGTPRPW